MFDDDKLYPANDPALAVIGSYSTLAQWRHHGRGPAYVKLGSKVAYAGAALNEWIAERTVDPTDPPTQDAAA